MIIQPTAFCASCGELFEYSLSSKNVPKLCRPCRYAENRRLLATATTPAGMVRYACVTRVLPSPSVEVGG